MTEFLQLFVTNHLKRMESSSKFPVNTLLEVLCHHTFQQTSTVNGYLRCLDVWTTLLESTQSRYSGVALALAERILQKMSFKFNARVLRDLDTESLDENVCINLCIYNLYKYNLEIRYNITSTLLNLTISFSAGRDRMAAFSEMQYRMFSKNC